MANPFREDKRNLAATKGRIRRTQSRPGAVFLRDNPDLNGCDSLHRMRPGSAEVREGAGC